MNIELGKLIKETQDRDAIHIAVAPVIAAEKLYPGQHVGLKDRDSRLAALPEPNNSIEPIGIVDPFLTRPVWPEQEFWLLLYQNTITDMRHHWSHPDFTPEKSECLAPKQEAETRSEPRLLTVQEQNGLRIIEQSKAWIEKLADDVGVSYGVLMEGAKEWITDGDYLIGRSAMEGERTPDEFWIHYQIVTGEIVEDEKKENFFSCSC